MKSSSSFSPDDFCSKKMSNWAAIMIACVGLCCAGLRPFTREPIFSGTVGNLISRKMNPYRTDHHSFLYGTASTIIQWHTPFLINAPLMLIEKCFGDENRSSKRSFSEYKFSTVAVLYSEKMMYNVISNMLVVESDLSFEGIQILKLVCSMIGCAIRSNTFSCLNLFHSIQDICFLIIKDMRCRYQLNWQQHKLGHPKATFSSTNFCNDFFNNIKVDVKNIMSKISFWMPYCLASLTIRILCTSLMPFIKHIDGFDYKNSVGRYAQSNILSTTYTYTEIFPRVE